MKAILISIRPQWVVKILNGRKTIEIRKKFLKDYVGWVYIYCTKDKKIFLRDFRDKKKWGAYWRFVAMENDPSNVGELPPILNGKVIARFWCDKVEEHKDFGMFPYRKLRYNKATCLSEEDLEDYGFVEGKGFVPLYAIHITKLEIFDKPKEISEFKVRKYDCNTPRYKVYTDYPLTRAPQSWCYLEV